VRLTEIENVPGRGDEYGTCDSVYCCPAFICYQRRRIARAGERKDALLAADAAWLKVYAAKDLDKSVAFCDEEGSMLAPNSPIATGRDALTKLIGSAFAIPDYKLAWHPNKVGVARSGDLGYT